MGKRIIRRRLTPEETKELRNIITKARWTQASSPEYRTAPHQYICWFQPRGFTAREWKRFAALIRVCGQYREWRGNRFCYLLLGHWACPWRIDSVPSLSAMRLRASISGSDRFRCRENLQESDLCSLSVQIPSKTPTIVQRVRIRLPFKKS